jgi:hypothetical protein
LITLLASCACTSGSILESDPEARLLLLPKLASFQLAVDGLPEIRDHRRRIAQRPMREGWQVHYGFGRIR